MQDQGDLSNSHPAVHVGSKAQRGQASPLSCSQVTLRQLAGNAWIRCLSPLQNFHMKRSGWVHYYLIRELNWIFHQPTCGTKRLRCKNHRFGNSTQGPFTTPDVYIIHVRSKQPWVPKQHKVQRRAKLAKISLPSPCEPLPQDVLVSYYLNSLHSLGSQPLFCGLKIFTELWLPKMR